MSTTNIEWTDRVWNPVTGCTKVSPGCKNCYAETVANRFFASQYPMVPIYEPADGDCDAGPANLRPRVFTDVMTHEDRLTEPLRWRKPQRVFVNSMSDLFHEDVSDAFIDRVFAVMALCPQHTFQILTKRAARMRDYVTADDVRQRIADVLGFHHGKDDTARSILGQSFNLDPTVRWPLPNVWPGFSAENQATFDERWAAVEPLARAGWLVWCSAEPLLGPIDLRIAGDAAKLWDGRFESTSHAIARETERAKLLRWLVCGGESGPGARPCDLAWIRSIVAQCKAAGVASFVKQLGAWPLTERFKTDVTVNGFPIVDGPAMAGNRILLRDRKGGDIEEFPADLRIREMPTVETFQTSRRR